MKTVSFELAKKLKEAGLRWEPDIIRGTHIGDTFYYPDGRKDALRGRDYDIYGKEQELIFAPTLDQLLEWLEGKGYVWELDSPWGTHGYYGCHIYKPGTNLEMTCRAISAEDAVGEAALWVLEQEAKHGGGA